MVDYPPYGWLRVNAILGRCDSHCAAHHGCKFDGSLKLGKLGLQLAWLESTDPLSPLQTHTLAKEVVSSEQGMEARVDARARAATSQEPLMQALILLERSCMSTTQEVEEPRSFACRNFSAVIAQLQAPDSAA